MVAVERLITDNLDIWASAVKTKSAAGRGRGRGNGKKIDLYGIKKLRELILELAVRGLLVPQDASDEPASELLEKIAGEKAQLVKEGKIKKQKVLPEIGEDEKPFELPVGWVFSRLGGAGYWAIGSGFPKNEQGLDGESILFSKVSDMNLAGNEKYIQTTVHTVSKETAARLKLNIHTDGTVIFPKIGGAIATNKRRIIIKPTVIDNNCLGISPANGISTDYVYLYLQSLDLAKYQAGTSMPALSQSTLELIVFGLPPLAEQHRIVTKVDELMALCDQLEQQTEAGISAHQTLVQTLLGTLANTTERDGFTQAWARIAEHFDTLFTTEWSIDQLKQTILQLAVMGKLVPQDSNDEPSCTLFEKLSAKRDQWINENIDSNPECKTMSRKLGKLTEPSLPFPIPKSWSCVHLIQLSQLLVDCHNKTAPYVDSGIPIIRTTNIRDREFHFEGIKYVNEETYEYWSRRCPPKSGDIMFTREAPMGEAAIIPEGVKWCLGQRTMLIRPMHGYVSEKYLLLALTEPHLLERASEHAIGSTVKHLRVGDVENLNIPLPPFEEQKHIAAKVDELFSICESLKTQLNTAQSTQIQLADAMAEQAVA
jgi:type I restriction enzyme S subunit